MGTEGFRYGPRPTNTSFQYCNCWANCTPFGTSMTFGVQMGWRVCSLRVSEGEGFQSWGMVEWGRCTNKWVADKMSSSRSPWSWLSSLCPQWREGCFGSDMFHHFLLSCHAFWGRNLWGPGDMEIRGVKRMVAHTADLSQPKTSMEVVEVDWHPL